MLFLLQAWIGKSLIKKFKKTLFSMNGSKAPGPNGFPTDLFIRPGLFLGGCLWMLQSHFSFLGNSLKTNATIPTLVPKRPNPSMMGDFRPNWCKCSSKKHFGECLSKKLSTADCGGLVEKVLAQINSWLSKKLSFAGRLQLISSILYSVQVYWSSVFILPKQIIGYWNKKLVDSFGLELIL
jgi:hypothetical protein